MAPSPMVKLCDGNSLAQLGLGTWDLRGRNPGDPGYEAIKNAIKAGYRHIDTAALYFNEEVVGAAVNDAIKEGLVKREEIAIVTKIWCTSHKRASVMKSAKKSCEAMGLAYVDMLLIHWPMGYVEDADPINPKDSNGKLRYSDTDITETWQGMEDVKDAGLAKSIGLSNFNHEMIDRLLAMCRHKPTVNQVECHPYLSQRKLLDYCNGKNIYLTAFCPLGAPQDPSRKKEDPKLMTDPVINKIAQKYKKNAGQVLIKYQLQRNVIVIPKSVNKDRLESNMDVFDFELSKDDMNELEKLNRNFRYCTNAAGEYPTDHKDWPLLAEY